MKNNEKKILLLVYALSPTRGSEYAVAWNYITEMSKEHDLTILYGTTSDHLGEICPPDEYQTMFLNGNVHLVPVYSTWLIRWVNFLNRKGIFVYSFYFAYTLWHRKVFRIAYELIRRQHFDLIHYLAPIGYREPGYLWKINLPYIWGPIGGMSNIKPALLTNLSFSGKIKLRFRTIANKLQLHFSSRVHRALRRADVLLASTMETKEIIKSIFDIDSIYLPENAIRGEIIVPDSVKFTILPINLVWIGRIDANKSLGTLLDAIVLMKHRVSIQLHIVGDGPQEKIMRQKAKDLGINESIIWHGKVARQQVFKILNNSHLHLNTSCMEGNPTTIWEAMAFGVPTMSLDHCGMHDTICDQCGIKIPVTHYQQIIADIAVELDKLTRTPERLQTLAVGATRCAQKYSWKLRREFFNNIYDVTISRFEQRSKVTNN